MPNVQGTPSTGMFVGYPAANPLADAFSALATSMAAKRKYDMDQQNALRNAMAPQLAAGLQVQPPAGGGDIQGLLAMMAGQQPQPGAAPWGIGQNPKSAIDAATAESNIGRNTVQNQYDQFKMSPAYTAAEAVKGIYGEAAKSQWMNKPGQGQVTQDLATNAYQQLLQLLSQQGQTAQANAPTQPAAKEWTEADVTTTMRDHKMSRSEVLALMKKNGLTLSKKGIKPS